MGDYRSSSYNDGMQIEKYYEHRPNPSPYDLSSHSVSYVSPYERNYVNDFNLKRGKSLGGSSIKSWGFNDPEFKRKKRVASYKVYSVEGKVKGSFRKSIRWIKVLFGYGF